MREHRLEAALADLGFTAARLVPLTARPTGVVPGAYLVTTADGRVIKARVARSSRAASRAETWTRALGDPRVPAPLLVRGRLMIEAWVDGTPLVQDEVAPVLLDRAARLLAAVHRFAGPGFPQLRSAAPIRRRMERQLDELVGAGLIRGRQAAGLRQIVAVLPARGAWGLRHGDFCAENLLLTPGGELVSIDNAHVTSGYLEYDLARSWYRWPRPAAATALFEQRYDEHAGSGAELAERRAWRAAAAVKGLHIRYRHRWPPDRPLAALAELLG